MSARRHGGVPVGALAALVLAIVATGALRARPDSNPCRLLEVGSDLLKSEDCVACHRWERCHPIEVVYRDAQARQTPGGGGAGYLRPEEVAVSRGAYLPDGRVRCVTCHDRHSRAGSHLAVPASTPRSPAPPEAAVADKGCAPLCLECHPWRD
jgi:hypothetical protein